MRDLVFQMFINTINVHNRQEVEAYYSEYVAKPENKVGAARNTQRTIAAGRIFIDRKRLSIAANLKLYPDLE